MTYDEFIEQVVLSTKNIAKRVPFFSHDIYFAKTQEILNSEDSIRKVYHEWIEEKEWYIIDIKKRFEQTKNDDELKTLIHHTAMMLIKIITIDIHHSYDR